jgi:hypothetical protein
LCLAANSCTSCIYHQACYTFFQSDHFSMLA